jgi:hypothetical protein
MSYKLLKTTYCVLLFLFISPCYVVLGQNFSDSWEGYFSYNKITGLAVGSDVLYAASSNAAFSFDNDTNTTEKFSTIEGLEGESIATNYFSEENNVHVIGYENGLIEIVQGDGDVLTEVEIVNKQTIPPNAKRINHIMEYNDLAYISTDFGIVVYDLVNLEFGETFFIGTNGAQIKVNQTTIHLNPSNGQEYIYAATQNNAVKRAPIDSPNLIDFSLWEAIGSATPGWLDIVSTQDRLFVTGTNRRLYEITGTTFTILTAYASAIEDFRISGEALSLTTIDQAFLYGLDLSLQAQVNLADLVDFNSNFTTSLLLNNRLYVGTQEEGILQFTLPDVLLPRAIKPSGPLFNLMSAIAVIPNEIWAVFGKYTESYGFGGPGVRKAGISHLIEDQWMNIPYDTVNAVKLSRDVDYLNSIIINPNNSSQVFASSYFAGLVEISDGEVVGLFDRTNSSLVGLGDFLNLSLSSAFDQNGVLWTLNSRVNEALNSYNGAQWQNYSFEQITDPNLGYSKIAIDNEGNKYVGCYSSGVIGFNESGNQITSIDSGNGDLPSNDVRAVAIDNNSNLWIGSVRGLRVLFNASQLLTADNPTAQPIIILEDGVPKELLFEQAITDIVVDGANNKWIGTVSSGVFYFSSDGQETLQHFTKDNSPLPSNDIFDIAVEPESGKIFFATAKGLVSYNSGGSNPSGTLEDVFVYPNPVRPEYKILGFDDLKDINLGVKIKGLTNDINIKITDVEGNLVAEGQSGRTLRFDTGLNLGIDGGTAIWNGKNFAGNVVATGVYIILISDLESLETTVKKVMIVR